MRRNCLKQKNNSKSASILPMNLKQIQDKPIGVLLLAGALLINRFFSGSPSMDFFAGMLTGLSLVLNIKYIIVVSKKRKLKHLHSSE